MAIKQVVAMNALQEIAAEVIKASVCAVDGGWLALVNTEAGKRLAVVVDKDTPLSSMLKETEVKDAQGTKVILAGLNANNAAVVRRFVKWAAPSACGTRGTSVGFSDWLGCADAFVVDLFAKRQIKPVLVDYTPEDSIALQRNFLEAVDTATWGVLEAGYNADINVFDLNALKVNSTFSDVCRYASGMDYVIVNGVPVIAKGEHTGARAGKVLRHLPKR